MAWAFHQAGIGTPFDYCYFPWVSEGLKSFDIQTIYAIMWAKLAVSMMARSLSFWDRQIAANFCID